MTTLQLISQAKSDPENSKNVPTMEIVINKGIATPADKAASKVVILNDWFREPTNIGLKDTNLVNLVQLFDPPKWKLSVTLYNTYDVKEGDRVYINTFLSFDEPSGSRISAGDINEGDWLFPIIVTADGKDYLLAQVHVKIAMAAAPAGAANQSDTKPAADKPAEDKLTVGKLTADKITAEKFTADKVTMDKPAKEGSSPKV